LSSDQCLRIPGRSLGLGGSVPTFLQLGKSSLCPVPLFMKITSLPSILPDFEIDTYIINFPSSMSLTAFPFISFDMVHFHYLSIRNTFSYPV
jgi:hypothetical protein